MFELNRSYSTQSDILYGGLAWTAKRGAWLPDTEVRLFAIGYDDQRDISDGGLSNDHGVRVYTAGISLLGVRPHGAGSFDYLLWLAVQGGDFPDPRDPTRDLRQAAWAALLELGYQWTELRGAPCTPERHHLVLLP